LASVADVETQPRLRTILGAFLFSGEDVEKPVAVLSGGEKSRLALAKMLLRPANLLCLDEPTNHLDVTAREILEEALEQFEGTMLFISHDRYFINRIATKVVEVRDSRLWEFAGDYDYYLDKKGEEEPAAGNRGLSGWGGRPPIGATSKTGPALESQRRSPSPEPKRPSTAKPRSKEERRVEAEARLQRSRAIAPLKARLKELEVEIGKIEARVRDLNDQMANPDLYRDSDRTRDVARERKVLEEQAASLYGKWEELALRLESAVADGGS
jgi:ATP-binding cassette subfamily F protein 3